VPFPLPADAGPAAAPSSPPGGRAQAALSPGFEAAGAARLTDLALWAGLAAAGSGVPSASGSAEPAPLGFDAATGLLAVQGDAGGGAVREAVSPAGFLELTVGGRLHSGDPAAASFDPALAGATASTLAGIRFDGGGQGTLVLGPQSLAGSLTVHAAGAQVITQDVAVAGQLVVQAPQITVGGDLRGRAVALASAGWVGVQAAGRIDAGQGAFGGRIEVVADKFANSGQLHADGRTGGQVVVRAGNILNAGPVTADGTAPGGSGGQVRLAFTGAYIDTTAAVTSASSAAGPGGRLTLDGGPSGHLFSSGRHRVTGSVGGAVDLLGREVVLAGAAVDASGEAGGGAVRIGGDSQGRNPAVADAQTVTVTPASTIRADALRTGGGGRVAVWADNTTAFDGAMSARGGPAGGPGGSLEVSGQGGLSYGGSADAGAPSGKAGTLLLDPKNLIISRAPVGVFPQFDLINPHPTGGGTFGTSVVPLSGGNIVVTNPDDNFGGFGAGAVYLFNGRTGALLSSLVGDVINGGVGADRVTALSNGNYVVVSVNWNNARGAATWGSGATGVSGVVSDANSLVGSTDFDRVGDDGLLVLSNGNYVVRSELWNDHRGAVTWGNGTTGVRGTVSAANSLVGSNPNDDVGGFPGTVTALSTGHYLVRSPLWNGQRGAVTWGSGTQGVRGAISEANSLVGTDPGDLVGSDEGGGVIALGNGNYVVDSQRWNGRRGAVTWGSGTEGVRGAISETNSLVGSNPADLLGGVIPLRNGNYVVVNDFWNGQRGAVTWGSGTQGVRGTVSEANSLVGSNGGDLVGRGAILALSNGNYVVRSPSWNGQRGAMTWGSGTEGIRGVVSEANSLVGSNPGELVSVVSALSNDNYVVSDPAWNGSRGAVTWGDGTEGVCGAISEANSLVGANPSDRVGNGGIAGLNNGNYLVLSPSWNFDRGAVTWGSGTKGIRGVVSAANSLVGATNNDQVGTGGITALGNGNYVVRSPVWNAIRGAVTWGDGTTGVSGAVSADNSLVGSNTGDQAGSGGITALSNGNYVVRSPEWNGQRGAVTWGSGTEGVRGTVSADNSLVGSNVSDRVGSNHFIVLGNGNYLVQSVDWNGRRGAVTWGDGTEGVRGPVSEANSLVGSSPNDLVGNRDIMALGNGNYLVIGEIWNGGRGAVTWGSGTAGVSGPVSAANSLVGTAANDFVGFGGITVLNNGNYVVRNSEWNGQRGAVTWGSGTQGVTGPVSAANSLVGSNPADLANSEVISLSTGDYVVRSPLWRGGALQSAGAATWVSGTTGQTSDGGGIITPQNSLVGRIANAGLRPIVEDRVHQTFMAAFLNEGGGRVTVGLAGPGQLTYDRAQAQTVTLTPDFLTHTLDTGTAVVLQASNDITVEDPIAVHAGGNGGALTLGAGRSIILNAGVSTDNGALTLVANDTLADGVVDSQREPGNAFITMAGGAALDTGAGPLDIELRDGAGRTNTGSRAINLQAISAGSVTVVNNGPSAGSDVRVGPVTTSGPQNYGSPHGVTVAAGDLTANDFPITFTDSVVVADAVRVGAGPTAVHFAGGGTQTLQSGAGAGVSNLDHDGSGTLRLLGGLAVAGTLIQAAGTFDANDQPVTVGRAAAVTGGTYLAGTAPQTFVGGLVLTGGAFTSSTGPMTVGGGVTLTGGSFGGEGAVDVLTVFRGTVAPGTAEPGVLAVAGPVTFNPLTTFRALLSGSAYSQLLAGGPVDLGGGTLSLAFGSEPPVGGTFEVLATADPGPIVNMFAGLPEGAVFSQGGFQLQITYQGGAGGNSVVLTRLA
jgi:hypothetical protein